MFKTVDEKLGRLTVLVNRVIVFQADKYIRNLPGNRVEFIQAEQVGCYIH